MDVKIYPSKLIGTVSAPSSKSYSHRMIIAAALADGVSEISNVTDSNDITVTSQAMEALGANVLADSGTYTVRGIKIPAEKAEIDCGESGSTLRFIIPVAAALGTTATLNGHAKLPQRPITPYTREFPSKGVTFEPQSGLPITLTGKLRAGEYNLEGDVSSQFITGLMLALPMCEEDSVIKLTSPLQSKPYADMTIAALKKFGIDIREMSMNSLPIYLIKGGQKYKPCRTAVEGDYSQAAFFFTANALGSEIKVTNLDPNSVQGDKAILDIIASCGDDMKPFTADVADIPDLVPILAVLGSFTKGQSRIVNAARLKLKESDRLTCVANALNAIGGKVTAGDDFLTMEHIDTFTGGEVDSCKDHRIVMAAAIAATASNAPVIIHGAEDVKKSYPRFFDDFKSLGGQFEIL
ncbi:MAG: 3-phosphoshikimate 1-carboxyvinyltransferase [Oscillospiraceae bacterium]|nr:3-phosphoshikimate 1-carboxyvinyltransferase [Oscillospiraceae bacterium]MDY6207842.1 3-phosphoshikimate 1-carboxyvinyltransferase [Oscillospiraceae bacterium]